MSEQTLTRAAVVTGGSRGIGRAVCTALAKQGVNVVVNYCHGEAAAAETVALCKAAGADAVAVQADVSTAAGCKALFDAAAAAFGRVVAERIRRAVANTRIRISPTVELNVTVSIGGAFAMQWIRSTTQLWTDRADHQLYQAKASGRNRVSIEEQPDSTVSAEEKSLLFGPLYTPSGWGDLPPLDPNPTGSAY